MNLTPEGHVDRLKGYQFGYYNFSSTGYNPQLVVKAPNCRKWKMATRKQKQMYADYMNKED